MKQHSQIWYAKRISDNNAELQEYSAPQSLYLRCNYLTIMPATSRGYSEVLKYGETLEDTWTAIANDNIFHNKFEIGDVFYLDGEKPNESLEEKYGYGSTANSVIKSIAYSGCTISITLVRNQSKIVS